MLHMLQLSDKRRVGAGDFKEMQMISIHEYWEKDGELLPSKKVLFSFTAMRSLSPRTAQAYPKF